MCNNTYIYMPTYYQSVLKVYPGTSVTISSLYLITSHLQWICMWVNAGWWWWWRLMMMMMIVTFQNERCLGWTLWPWLTVGGRFCWRTWQQTYRMYVNSHLKQKWQIISCELLNLAFIPSLLTGTILWGKARVIIRWYVCLWETISFSHYSV